MNGESTSIDEDLPCIDFVELVTDYIDEAIDPEVRRLVDDHLVVCSGCRTVLAQWREIIVLTGRLAVDEVDRIDPLVRDALVAAFSRAHPPS